MGLVAVPLRDERAAAAAGLGSSKAEDVHDRVGQVRSRAAPLRSVE